MIDDRKLLYRAAEATYRQTHTDLILKEGSSEFLAAGHHQTALRSAVDTVLTESFTPTNVIAELLLAHQLREDTAWKAEYNYKCSCNAFSANSAETHAEHVAEVIQEGERAVMVKNLLKWVGNRRPKDS